MGSVGEDRFPPESESQRGAPGWEVMDTPLRRLRVDSTHARHNDGYAHAQCRRPGVAGAGRHSSGLEGRWVVAGRVRQAW